MVRVEEAPSLSLAGRRHEWPSVGVVIVTQDRPHLLRRAICSVAAQDYPGPMRVVVVFDGVSPDWRVAAGINLPVRAVENWRRTGIAGARNAGVLCVADCDLVAFCDDWDTWTPQKLTAQVTLLRERPGALACSCTVEVEYDGQRRARPLGRTDVRPQELARPRAASLRLSGLVAERDALANGPVGLLDELAPPGGEDWDLLVRVARLAPIAHLDTGLVRALWRSPEANREACRAELATLHWMLDHHPDLTRRRRSAAALYGQLAGWHAAAGQHRSAWRWAARALRAWCLGASASAAVLAASGLVGRDRLVRRLRQDGLG